MSSHSQVMKKTTDCQGITLVIYFDLYIRRQAKENFQGILVRLSFEKGDTTDISRESFQRRISRTTEARIPSGIWAKD